MPFPSKLSLESIVDTAIDLIEAEGVEKLSVNVLAQRLSVKTPSLYRYVKSKTELLQAVNAETIYALFRHIGPPLQAPGTAEARIIRVAQAYRAFAHSRPITYGLAFTNTIPELYPDADETENAVLPFQALMAEISGEADSLAALRGLQALIHGFAMLELAGQFQRGGDLNAAFNDSVRAYIRGWRTPE
ncbi:MAG: WHG domain-containing protein [Anaerolineae bacterium]|nr:WHG domain-containing protein [Anaerolineae bacterium]